MTDMELADLLKEMTVAVKYFDPDAVTKVGILWPRIIAALRRGPEQDDKEIGEFQQRVYELCEKFYPEVDGAGSDTGDWRDFTFAEIRQTLNHLAERPPSGEMVMVPRELLDDLRRYGVLRPITGVVYNQPHSLCLERLELLLSAAEAEGRKP